MDITDRLAGRVADIVSEYHGMRATPPALHLLSAAIEAVAARHGDAPHEILARVLSGEPAAVASVAGEISVKETYLFRDAEDLVALTSHIVPAMPPGREIAIWSAGCATGEEVWSLLVAMEGYRQCRGGVEYRILGTDLSPAALRLAASGGHFREARTCLDGLPSCLRSAAESGLESDGDGHLVPAPATRGAFDRRVSLLPHDLLHMPAPGEADVVFLRNVLIYYGEEDRLRILGHVADALRRPGWLFVADVEIPAIGAAAQSLGFRTQSCDGTLAYRLG